MPVFFIPSSAIQKNIVTLSDPLYTHLHKSLRVRMGQTILVCDEQRQRHSLKITEITKKILIGTIQETLIGPPIAKPIITLAQSVLKNENMAWSIQKATELGVSTIIPLITERVTSRTGGHSMNHHVERWQRIALEAAQQSERWDVPTILTPQPFHVFLENLSSTAMIFLLTERLKGEHSSPPLFEQTGQPTSEIILTVGPEGGWSQKEMKKAECVGVRKITLGEQVLRSETAALAGLTLIQEQLGEITFRTITGLPNPPA